jgi:hypothetical protein
MNDQSAHIHLNFARGGNAPPYCLSGWWPAEQTFTWSRGLACELKLPTPPGGRDLILELAARPLLGRHLTAQRLIISVNGREVARDLVGGEVVLHVTIPRDAVIGSPYFVLRFDHPDGRTAAQAGGVDGHRELGFAFSWLAIMPAAPAQVSAQSTRPPLPGRDRATAAHAAKGCTALDMAALAGCFESLGHNCEFGLVQRHFGAVSLGLMRYSTIGAANLLQALRQEFGGFLDPGNLHIDVVDGARELMLKDRTYGSVTHLWAERGTVDEGKLLESARERCAMQLRIFRETLRLGHKIFVFHHPNITSDAAVRPIAAALHERGPNILLWVSVTSNAMPPGSARLIAPGLMHGTVVDLAPRWHWAKCDLVSWTSILGNAYRMARESGWVPGLED